LSAASSHAGPRAWSLLRTLSCGLLLAKLALPAAAQSYSAKSLLNRMAPEFTRKDLSGRRLDLASFRGKVVLLNFWATWCAPCLVEMPEFAAWQREYGPRGFQVAGISMDDTTAPVLKLVERLKLDYPVAMGDARLGELYGGVLGLPVTYLIDRRGVVRARFDGETNLEVIAKQVGLLLNHR